MNRPDPILHAAEPTAAPHPGLSFRAFVTMIALLFAMTALTIDTMLPAFPAIARSLELSDTTQAQWVLYAFLFGLGVGQPFYGPLADRFGRRAVLIPVLLAYAVTSIVAGASRSFELLLAARVAQGLSVAGVRVMSVAIVRDCYSGRKMARVMSLTFMVFMIVPIVAPSIGQAIMLVAPWRWIFYLLAGFGLSVALWAGYRLPETLHPEYRRPMSFGAIARATRMVLGNRISLGYTLAIAVLSGVMFGYLGSAQQIFDSVFGVPELFPAIFAACAVLLACASYLNSRVVERLGMRLVSHSALIAFTALAAIHIVITLVGWESLWLFAVFQAFLMAAMALANSNFNAMAMEPVGEVAGIAASIQGLITTVVGAALGMAVGQHFDGTTLPLLIGYLIFGVGTLAIVLVAERGRLFRAHQPLPGGAARS